MLYRYWLRLIPLLVNSRLAAWLCALELKFSRSLTHHAPDAAKPAMVWAGAVTTAVDVAAWAAGAGARASTPPVPTASSRAPPSAVDLALRGYDRDLMMSTPLIRA